MAPKIVRAGSALLLRCLAIGVLVLAAVAMQASNSRAANLTRGFEDDVWFNAGWRPWIPRIVHTGAKVVSLEIDWAHVEPKAPPDANAASPSAGQYQFKYVDNVLKRFNGTGVQPVFLITDAPRWAEGKGGTRTQYAEGGFEPNPAAFEQFASALAARYSGKYRDPANRRHFLPKVLYFQAWGEANMGYHLSPQWTRVDGHLVNNGPIIYRSLLNAFYAGIKAGNPAAKVVFTGLEAYGDAAGGMRTPPVTFLRSVLCLNARLAKEPCSDPAHFDVLASDPYEVGSPTTHAISRNDASAPDLGRLTRVLKAAIAAQTVAPATPKPLWVTEFSYDSDPPNPTPGTPSEDEQAHWLEESLYVFAHEGVSTVIWYLLHDQTGSFTTAYFSGVYFHNGRPKTSLTAYQFPFVVMRSAGSAQAWGIAPSTGTVEVQREVDGSWEKVFSFTCLSGGAFSRNMPLSARGLYRAVEGGRVSLVWAYRTATPRRRGGSGAPGITVGSAASPAGRSG